MRAETGTPGGDTEAEIQGYEEQELHMRILTAY